MSEKDIKVFAHRGGMMENLENSYDAFVKALDLGVFAVETDFQRTKDNKLIIAHDKNLKGITGQNVLIKNINYDEIKPFLKFTPKMINKVKDLKPPRHKPMLLEDFFKIVHKRQVCINLDCKTPLVEDLKEAVLMAKKFNLIDRTIFGSFHHYDIKALKK